MVRSLKFVGLATSVLLLAGCSVFYPNWGATSLPEEPELATSEPAATDSEAESTEPEATESATTEPTESEEPKPEPKSTDVEIIMAAVEPDYGVLTVVAQVPGVSDSGGSCTVRFQSGNFERKLTVKAEPSSGYTQCFPIEFELKDLQSGKGLVTVSYSSDLYEGTSAASSVDIP
jgi:hypothetical protein